MFKFLLKLFSRKKVIKTNGCFDEIDPKNFGAEVLAGDVSREDLIDSDFNTCNISELIDQEWTDFCVGCSGAYAKEATEHKKMSWAGAYALACKYIGYVPDFGMSILAMMKARVKFGIPEERFYPFQKNKSKAYLANYRNLTPKAIENAYSHRDKSYFQIKQGRYRGWDKFDLFRAYLSKLKGDYVVINTGADEHAISLCIQKTINAELRIGGPDSYGDDGLKYRLGITINGWRYFNRQEINQFYNGYIGSDMDRAKAELLNTYNNKAVKLYGDPRCYLIKNGEKHRLKNEYIAWAYNTLLFDDDNVKEIKKEELDKIPEGEDAKFREGEDWRKVQRMLEKTATMTQEGIKKVLEDLNNQ